MQPFFSIITVSYNAEDLIEATIDSALKQTYENFEIIVQDGMSTDKTLERIQKDKRIKVICEKDYGIYDAMEWWFHV